ncbi:hypothetical protein HK102_000257, partial [Quaeritorhiza haematococci]
TNIKDIRDSGVEMNASDLLTTKPTTEVNVNSGAPGQISSEEGFKEAIVASGTSSDSPFTSSSSPQPTAKIRMLVLCGLGKTFLKGNLTKTNATLSATVDKAQPAHMDADALDNKRRPIRRLWKPLFTSKKRSQMSSTEENDDVGASAGANRNDGTHGSLAIGDGEGMTRVNDEKKDKGDKWGRFKLGGLALLRPCMRVERDL